MPETLDILNNASKTDIYKNLLPQIEALIQHESNLYANLANISAALKETFKFFWVGFYLVDTDNNKTSAQKQLVLGPFQVSFYYKILSYITSTKLKWRGLFD
jgi:L-methionine (R)-S-oxide reductase